MVTVLTLMVKIPALRQSSKLLIVLFRFLAAVISQVKRDSLARAVLCTFLTLMVKAFLRSIWSVGLLMVHVLFRVLPGLMSSKSKDANWPGRQKDAFSAGRVGTSNSNVMTSRDSCLVLMQRSLCTFRPCSMIHMKAHPHFLCLRFAN